MRWVVDADKVFGGQRERLRTYSRGASLRRCPTVLFCGCISGHHSPIRLAYIGENRMFDKFSQQLTLLMLADIHEKLEIQHSVDPAFVREMVMSGELWAVAEAYPQYFRSSEVEAPDCLGFVRDTLYMWHDVEVAYDELSERQKYEVSQQLGMTRVDAPGWFVGFSKKHDPAEHRVLHVLMSFLGEVPNFGGRSLDPCSSWVPQYREMLNVYGDMEIDHRLSIEQLVTLFRAWRGPELVGIPYPDVKAVIF